MKVYVFPYSSKVPEENANPYIHHLMKSLDRKMEVVNMKSPASSGIFDILKYRKGLDAVFFNWIENIPERKGGIIQMLIYFLLVRYLKRKGVRLVFTLHNKLSHSKTKLLYKRWIFKDIILMSDLIITHSSEGIRYLSEHFSSSTDKAWFIPHPVDETMKLIENVIPFKQRPWDILIWGTMSPYKGVDKFFEYLEGTGLRDKFNIMLKGKFSDREYYKKLVQMDVKAEVSDAFASEDELQELMQKSRIILFTYNRDSVLSSGALIDSLFAPCFVIGPDTGAFRDLASEGLADSYQDFSDLVEKIEKLIRKDISSVMKGRTRFIEENGWKKFGHKISEKLFSLKE